MVESRASQVLPTGMNSQDLKDRTRKAIARQEVEARKEIESLYRYLGEQADEMKASAHYTGPLSAMAVEILKCNDPALTVNRVYMDEDDGNPHWDISWGPI